MSEKPRPSELDDGLAQFGKVVGGIASRLLGSKFTGHTLDPDRPTLSPEADRALDQAGDALGRVLKAAGDSLQEHPTDPIAAFDQTVKHAQDPVHPRVGEAPLAEGLRSVVGGLFKTSEALLDKVAPRKPKAAEPPPPEDDDDGPPLP